MSWWTDGHTLHICIHQLPHVYSSFLCTHHIPSLLITFYATPSPSRPHLFLLHRLLSLPSPNLPLTEAVVLWSYEAQNDNELSLKVGNIISDVEQVCT